MSAKYIPPFIAGTSYGYHTPGCPPGQASAYDWVSEECLKIFGVGITIAGNTASWQGGFEVCNFNFHSLGTQRPVVTLLQLNAPVYV